MPASAPSANLPARKCPSMARHTASQSACGTRAAIARSATISTTWSAIRHVDQHAVVAGRIPDAELAEHEHRALVRRDPAARAPAESKAVSTAKRISPA